MVSSITSMSPLQAAQKAQSRAQERLQEIRDQRSDEALSTREMRRIDVRDSISEESAYEEAREARNNLLQNEKTNLAGGNTDFTSVVDV